MRSATCGHSMITSKMPPSPRPSPRVAVKPKQDRVGVCVDDLAVRLSRAVMAFIDQQQLGRRQVHVLPLHGARPECLDAAHLHELERARLHTGEDDPVGNTVGAQLVAGMRDDLAAMRDDEHTAAAFDDRLDDSRADDGLAGAGRRDEDDALQAGGDFTLEVVNHLVLIGAQIHVTTPVDYAGARRPARAPLAIVFCTERGPSSAIKPLAVAASISRLHTSAPSSSPPATS